ncbi:tRNA lysidine(34) synthetase TilS [Candidatus Pacearchaeota archaeon]|nr:tRNA lysidine(34) synthetase TilS [Candidatus Pacearchaeota archaeon]|tara:strand:+ start:2916 stop:3560 length:645 start_codon:yes stop_codon:yes gene_type:complete
MINILGDIPRRVGVALSGGLDSIAIYDFLVRDGKRTVYPIYFDHGTKHGSEAYEFVVNFVDKYKSSHALQKHVITNQRINDAQQKNESQEEYWRRIRYSFLDDVANQYNINIITCHHLDDVIETWIFSALHGTPKLIPFKRNRVIRPFLTTKKEDLRSWCERHDLGWIEDPSNKNKRFMRNFIRSELMPKARHINPGIQKTIKKKVIKEFKNQK